MELLSAQKAGRESKVCRRLDPRPRLLVGPGKQKLDMGYWAPKTYRSWVVYNKTMENLSSRSDVLYVGTYPKELISFWPYMTSRPATPAAEAELTLESAKE
jgi:hypothetical protein